MKVCHFIRKASQLKATFIYNQVYNHVLFEPFLVQSLNYNKIYDGGFAEYKSSLPILDLALNENWYDKLFYKVFKLVPARQITRLQEFIKESKIDVAHFHYGTDFGIYLNFTKQRIVPNVVSFYGYDCTSFPNYYLGLGKLFLNKRVFPFTDIVLAMSPDMANDLIEIGCPKDKIIVHYHGIDCNKFYTHRLYEDHEIINILTLGSLVPKKGHVFILKSLKQIIKSGITNFQLRIVGTGPMLGEIIDYINENELANYVSLEGPVIYGSHQMFDYYKNADIFVHPSIIDENKEKEGIPGTIVEAMSSGLPVVSTYHAGIPFIIENDLTGMLVDENDVDALSQVIKRLIQDSSLRKRIGIAGQNFAINNLDINIKEKELEKIYIDLINSFK